MNQGFQFETQATDGTLYRVIYTIHFAERFDLDRPGHPALRRTITEEIVQQKIEEAIPQLDDMIYGKSLKGVIVSRSKRFIMTFEAIETSKGFQLNMVTMSDRLDFKPKSEKEVVIEVNPTFTVKFTAPLSLGLKYSILADIAHNWQTLEEGVLYHLGGDLMDYWVERGGDVFYVTMADWAQDLLEIDVS
ncbi:MAG: hypothetical protein A2W26_01075 [Acidobacteria bacterium RBG_16_64_8]|nr:MAG: hypothetical protein A2W26_01075 [Acidobacteria bacterium RBG_16_64_8]